VFKENKFLDATEKGGTWNRYMVASLRTVARRYSSVVAVVGRGHLSGIAKHWKEDINVSYIFFCFEPFFPQGSYLQEWVLSDH